MELKANSLRRANSCFLKRRIYVGQSQAKQFCFVIVYFESSLNFIMFRIIHGVNVVYDVFVLYFAQKKERERHCEREREKPLF